MEKHHKFSIWYVLIAVWIVLILHNLIVQMFAVERLPYSEFVRALHAGKVMEVAITQDRIEGKRKVTKDGQEVEKVFRTVRKNTGDVHKIIRSNHPRINRIATLPALFPCGSPAVADINL